MFKDKFVSRERNELIRRFNIKRPRKNDQEKRTNHRTETDTGKLVEDTKTIEVITLKELGKLSPRLGFMERLSLIGWPKKISENDCLSKT